MKPDTFLNAYAESTVGMLLKIADDVSNFQTFFCGAIIANVVGNLDDDEWADFCRMEPCGRAGCDCHIKFQPLIKALTELRNDHHQHSPKSLSA